MWLPQKLNQAAYGEILTYYIALLHFLTSRDSSLLKKTIKPKALNCMTFDANSLILD